MAVYRLAAIIDRADVKRIAVFNRTQVLIGTAVNNQLRTVGI